MLGSESIRADFVSNYGSKHVFGQDEKLTCRDDIAYVYQWHVAGCSSLSDDMNLYGGRGKSRCRSRTFDRSASLLSTEVISLTNEDENTKNLRSANIYGLAISDEASSNLAQIAAVNSFTSGTVTTKSLLPSTNVLFVQSNNNKSLPLLNNNTIATNFLSKSISEYSLVEKKIEVPKLISSRSNNQIGIRSPLDQSENEPANVHDLNQESPVWLNQTGSVTAYERSKIKNKNRNKIFFNNASNLEWSTDHQLANEKDKGNEKIHETNKSKLKDKSSADSDNNYNNVATRVYDHIVSPDVVSSIGSLQPNNGARSKNKQQNDFTHRSTNKSSHNHAQTASTSTSASTSASASTSTSTSASTPASTSASASASTSTSTSASTSTSTSTSNSTTSTNLGSSTSSSSASSASDSSCYNNDELLKNERTSEGRINPKIERNKNNDGDIRRHAEDLHKRNRLDLRKREIRSDATNHIIEVWNSNLKEEFEKIMILVERSKYIALDTEFPGIVAHPSNIAAPEYNYRTLKCNVDLLNVIQLGITFADERGEIASKSSTWQFNFRFDMAKDMYAHDSIEFLRSSGVNFDNLKEKGIDPDEFGELIMSSGLVMNTNVTWISFHGCYDFGYMIKLLTCAPLPKSVDRFNELLTDFFPSLYDIKSLMKNCNTIRPIKCNSLQSLSQYLGVERIGRQHQAGSDSLVTCHTFFRLLRLYGMNATNLQSFLGLVYGLDEVILIKDMLTNNISNKKKSG